MSLSYGFGGLRLKSEHVYELVFLSVMVVVYYME